MADPREDSFPVRMPGRDVVGPVDVVVRGGERPVVTPEPYLATLAAPLSLQSDCFMEAQPLIVGKLRSPHHRLVAPRYGWVWVIREELRPGDLSGSKDSQDDQVGAPGTVPGGRGQPERLVIAVCRLA